MGCDIHMTLELKRGDHWLGLHSFEDYHTPARERNYRRFALIAGVRGDGPTPRGIPEDASELARLRIEHWDTDGHSHTWLSLDEATRIFAETSFKELDKYESKYPAGHFFGIHLDEVDPSNEYRLVIWFDN